MITKQKKGFSNKIGDGNQVADLCLRLDYFAHMTSLHYFDNISVSELIPLPKSWIRCSYLHFIFKPFTTASFFRRFSIKNAKYIHHFIRRTDRLIWPITSVEVSCNRVISSQRLTYPFTFSS